MNVSEIVKYESIKDESELFRLSSCASNEFLTAIIQSKHTESTKSLKFWSVLFTDKPNGIVRKSAIVLNA